MWNKWELEQLDVVKDVLSPKCPYCSPTGCEVYLHRPVVCRLFGAVDGMECPHGKRPAKRLSRDVTKKLTAEYWKLKDFKVLGIDGWLSKNADQESLRAVMNKIQAVVQEES
jgi:Fe-S-cluster containining protein